MVSTIMGETARKYVSRSIYQTQSLLSNLFYRTQTKMCKHKVSIYYRYCYFNCLLLGDRDHYRPNVKSLQYNFYMY